MSKIFVSKLLRKKYLMGSAITEINFLVDFYRDMSNKRGRSIAFKIEALDRIELESYLTSYLDMKQLEYKISSIEILIKN